LEIFRATPIPLSQKYVKRSWDHIISWVGMDWTFINTAKKEAMNYLERIIL
jgi:hypothetical protein